MLIICAGVLISLGFVALSTSNTGMMLTEKNVNYAEYTMAKNAAHTAIQMAMQEINQDNNWPNDHDINNPWTITVQDRDIALYTDYYQNPNYWDPDSLWLYSNADYLNEFVQVRTLYLKQPFSSLVPDFEGALTVAAEAHKFNFTMGGSSFINGDGPTGCENKPAITTMTGSGDNFSVTEAKGKKGVQGDPMVYENPDLSYQPTDEMIARLASTDGVQYISGNYKGSMGTQENPGVFFVEDNARLTGGISEGYGILVIRSDGYMEYEGEDGATLDIAGNFTFNGLIVFENAYNFTGRGTPTINGNILVGHTEDHPDHLQVDIDVSGNIAIQYDCNAEQYAKMAAANAVKQNKYTQVVTSENVRIPPSGSTGETLIEKVKSLL
ncbi:hypothetical protein DDZ15_13470 [Rhodohalobacter mucosus]|uniref:PilX N-terminal n=2 Tax=Rhodohalobacter mucosus TaxID=2079485 RepID=A0A316TTK0_9BACT|nr:hypothetical protein DDZ15_13470 [Rhodohalobacter mucosus]